MTIRLDLILSFASGMSDKACDTLFANLYVHFSLFLKFLKYIFPRTANVTVKTMVDGQNENEYRVHGTEYRGSAQDQGQDHALASDLLLE